MIEHILEEIQDKLASPMAELIERGIKPVLLNRINQIARSAYKDLNITYFTYDEMTEILGTDDPIKSYEGDNNVLFTFLKPNVEYIEGDEEQENGLSIVMSIDFKKVM